MSEEVFLEEKVRWAQAGKARRGKYSGRDVGLFNMDWLLLNYVSCIKKR